MSVEKKQPVHAKLEDELNSVKGKQAGGKAVDTAKKDEMGSEYSLVGAGSRRRRVRKSKGKSLRRKKMTMKQRQQQRQQQQRQQQQRQQQQRRRR